MIVGRKTQGLKYRGYRSKWWKIRGITFNVKEISYLEFNFYFLPFKHRVWESEWEWIPLQYCKNCSPSLHPLPSPLSPPPTSDRHPRVILHAAFRSSLYNSILILSYLCLNTSSCSLSPTWKYSSFSDLHTGSFRIKEHSVFPLTFLVILPFLPLLVIPDPPCPSRPSHIQNLYCSLCPSLNISSHPFRPKSDAMLFQLSLPLLLFVLRKFKLLLLLICVPRGHDTYLMWSQRAHQLVVTHLVSFPSAP